MPKPTRDVAADWFTQSEFCAGVVDWPAAGMPAMFGKDSVMLPYCENEAVHGAVTLGAREGCSTIGRQLQVGVIGDARGRCPTSNKCSLDQLQWIKGSAPL